MNATKTNELYHELHRPQFQFTPKVNWTNDPNRLVYYKGEYHMFFQLNAKGINPWWSLWVLPAYAVFVARFVVLFYFLRSR